MCQDVAATLVPNSLVANDNKNTILDKLAAVNLAPIGTRRYKS